MCPPMPPAELMRDHVFVPVVRPTPALVGSVEEEMVPPPAIIPPPMPSMPLQIAATGKRVKITCQRFEARCNRVSHLLSGDRIVLEGKVRLTFRGHDAGKVSAERIEIDMVDGTVEVNPAPVSTRPVVPVGYYAPVSQHCPPGLSRMAPPNEP